MGSDRAKVAAVAGISVARLDFYIYKHRPIPAGTAARAVIAINKLTSSNYTPQELFPNLKTSRRLSTNPVRHKNSRRIESYLPPLPIPEEPKPKPKRKTPKK